MRQNGLAVFHAGARAGANEAYLLQEASGIVLGKLFSRCGAGTSISAPLSIGASETARIDPGGRHLVDRYWGRYVAFLRDPPVTRAGCCAIRPQHCRAIRCSSKESLFTSGGRGAAVQLGSVTSQSLEVPRRGPMPYATTTERHRAGWRMAAWEASAWSCAQAAASTRCWGSVADRRSRCGRPSDRSESTALLHTRVHPCLGVMVYGGILHTLSGGLDSSIAYSSCLQECALAAATPAR